MDKKSIIGIVLIGILFFGFTIYSSRQQQKYQEELAAYQAAHPELTQPVVPDSSAVAAAPVVESLGAATPDSTRLAREVAVLGDFLAAAKNAAPQEIVVENDVMKVRFSTGGGIVRSKTIPVTAVRANATNRSRCSSPKARSSICRFSSKTA